VRYNSVIVLYFIQFEIPKFCFCLLQVGGDWEKLCIETLLRKISLWDEFYRNLFLDQVESLIETRMNGTVKLVLDHLRDPALSGEEDTFNFIWSEVGLNDNSNINNSNLLSMKTKAFSPHVQNVCQKLNASLQKLMEELFEYVDNNSTKDKNNFSTVDPLAFLNDRCEGGDSRESEPFSLTVDNQTILKFAQKTCTDSINKVMKQFRRIKTYFASLDLFVIYDLSSCLFPDGCGGIEAIGSQLNRAWKIVPSNDRALSCHSEVC